MKEEKPLYELKLLHAIQYRLGSDVLLELGLEYYQIAKLISNSLQKNLIIDTEDGLKLTDGGLQQLEILNKLIYPENSKSWLLPDDEYRVDRIDKFDIYLPKRKQDEE